MFGSELAFYLNFTIVTWMNKEGFYSTQSTRERAISIPESLEETNKPDWTGLDWT